MLRMPIPRALAPLGALLCLACLAACAPSTTVDVIPTATAPTATPTPVLAPPPTNAPAGWLVLATTHFSLAYPPDWTVQPYTLDDPQFVLWGPGKAASVQVAVMPQANVTTYLTSYCQPASEGMQATTFASLPMAFKLTGLGNSVRVWRFANAEQTLYLLSTGDVLGDAASQAQDTAILATFRPDDATPWKC